MQLIDFIQLKLASGIAAGSKIQNHQKLSLVTKAAHSKVIAILLTGLTGITGYDKSKKNRNWSVESFPRFTLIQDKTIG